MGESENKTSQRGILNNKPALFAIALIVVALIGLIPTVKGFGDVRAAHKEYKKQLIEAKERLSAAKEHKQAIADQIEQVEALDAEIEKLSSETMTLAAQVEKDVYDGKIDAKICYITLDDGPYNRGKSFIEIFRKYDVKATFFLCTANGDKLPDQADEKATSMYNEYLKYGHVIGNHTYSHNFEDGGIYKSADAFIKDMKKQEAFTEEATGGYKPQLIRFPGGTGKAGDAKEAIEKELREEGYGWVDWTVDSSDSWGKGNTSKKLILKQVKEAAKKQDIMVILFHEWSKESEQAMPEVIEYLQDEGYIFLPLFYDSVMVQK